MRAVALLPSLALAFGSASALVLPDAAPVLPVFTWLAIGALGAALVCWRLEHPVWLVCAVAVVFAAGGGALGRRAWQQAWTPPLRLAWERAAVGRRAASADLHGSNMPAVGDVSRANGASDDHDPREANDSNDAADAVVSAVVTGVIRTDAAVRDDGVSLSLQVRTVAFDGVGRHGAAAGEAEAYAPGGVRLTVHGAAARESMAAWRAGRVLRVPARLRRPSRHLNWGVADEERQLARRGTTLVGSVKSGLLVELVSRGSWWSETTARTRARTRHVIARHVGQVSPMAAGLVTAILIGDRAGLSDETVRTLQEAGTYHVVAISGGNIAVLAVLTLLAFRWAGVLGRGAMLVAVAGFVAFGSIVEGGASVDRAVTMAVLAFLARAADHRVNALHGLAVASACLIVMDPLAIADPGFLLSFVASGGLVVAASFFERGRRSRAWHLATSLFVASLAAELATLPVVAWLFGRATLAGLLLNFAAVPLMSVTQIAGLAVLALSAVSSQAADLMGWFAALGASALLRSAALVEWAPVMAWRVAPPHPLAVLAYYTALAASCWMYRTRMAACGSAGARFSWLERAAAVVWGVALAWILTAPWTWLAAYGDGRLHVTFIDVGQGDAALVRFPRGRAVLVDAGGSRSGSYDVGERVVGPVLRATGVRSLDTIVVTHPDVDHAGGVSTVLREFRPFEVWEGLPVPGLPLWRRLQAASARDGVRWTTVSQGHRMLIDGVQVTVHHPRPADWERRAPRNDDSVVLELVWRDVSFVFTGDIGQEVEASMADRFEPVPVRVLKVPHHGSPSSSSAAFLDALGPTAAVVSTGRGNQFGHPAAAVLQRYQDRGTLIFRTDTDGAVTMATDGYRLRIETFGGRTVTAEPARLKRGVRE